MIFDALHSVDGFFALAIEAPSQSFGLGNKFRMRCLVLQIYCICMCNDCIGSHHFQCVSGGKAQKNVHKFENKSHLWDGTVTFATVAFRYCGCLSLLIRARCFANSECSWGCLETRRVRYLAWSYTHSNTLHSHAVLWEQDDLCNRIFRHTVSSQPRWEFRITAQTLAKILPHSPI